ncbi:MAG: Tex-like N-terminal domain-containing protein [Planctomycetota bacterium]|nr:Tex-like N-terminal domain-containing protein [Planctomycetota bacterium]
MDTNPEANEHADPLKPTEATPEEVTSPEAAAPETPPAEAHAAPAEGSEPEVESTPAADAPVADAADAADVPPSDETPPVEAAAPAESEGTDAETPAAEAPAGEATDGDAPEGAQASGEEGAASADAGAPTPAPKPAAKKKPKKKRRPPPRAPEPPLPPELKAEAAAAARAKIVKAGKGRADATNAALDMLAEGLSIPYVARFRRHATSGLDERRLRNLRDAYHDVLVLEERRVAIRRILDERGALTDEAATSLGRAKTVGEMEDLAAPYLPVVASRATVARGQGLQPLADAVRTTTDEGPLSEVAKPFLPADAEGPVIDQALAAARDIVAEELCLVPSVRAELRSLYRKEGRLKVALRSERKGDAGRHASLVGFEQLASKVPPMKLLSIRRGEKDRVLVSTIEPPEEKALAIVHTHAAPDGHAHAGFLRAAAEDGYRRILKPILQNELRLDLKRKADEQAIETFERNFRNLLLGPYAGPRRVMGIRPDVTGGHRWCAVDAEGLPVGSGQLPHEPTAGREACLAELVDKLKTYECSAVAVGRTGGRAEAMSLAQEASQGFGDGFEVVEVADGGTRVLEAMGKLEYDDRPEVAAECRGAMSLARRFQDPLSELVSIDAKALGLGPHMHDVHQGRLRTMLDDVLASCVAFAGPDANTANADVLAHVPGFTRKAAQGLVAWRDAGGRLEEKAQVAAVDGVGPEIAEQAVGFLRIPRAADPRDRTQLHPSQYGLAESIAASVDADIATLFSDPRARSQVKLDALTDADTDIHTLRYVLYQATAGDEDPRPEFDHPIPPPPEITLKTLQPGLVLQGRVIRTAPFGVFIDVGLGCDALIPTGHIGDRPGLEQAQVAPVGAVVNAQVLDVEPGKKKLTLSMRRDAGPRGGGPRGRGPQRGRGPRRGEGRPDRGGGPRGQGRGQGRGRGERAGAGAGGGPRGRGQGDRPGGGGGPRRKGRPQKGGARKAGRYDGKGFSIFDRRGGRDDRRKGGPRTISLKPDDPKDAPEAEVVDEKNLTPEELMQKKLDEMRRKLEGK